jgi:hypothetical protein
VDVSGSSCPDHPFSVELCDMEINTQICGVLAHGADLNLGSSLIPIREGGRQPVGESVSTLIRLPVLISVSYRMRVPAQGPKCAHSAPKGSPYLRMW